MWGYRLESGWALCLPVEVCKPSHWPVLRLSTSPGYPRLTTGIPVGKPAGMETRGSKSLMITGLRGSGCVFWMLRVPATGTCQTIVFLFFIFHTVCS